MSDAATAERSPWRKGFWPFTAAAVVFSLLFPRFDLWVAGLFWRDGGFFLRDAGWVALLYDYGPWPALFTALAGFVVWFIAWVRGRDGLAGIPRRKAAFVLLALLLGPGILVNSVAKEFSERARPAQVQAFGGERDYAGPLQWRSGQCASNCSFVSGHAASGFFFVALSFVLAGTAARIAFWGGITFGSLIGLARMAAGGHFLTDVVFALVLVYAASGLLWWLLFRGGGAVAAGYSRRVLAASGNGLRHSLRPLHAPCLGGDAVRCRLVWGLPLITLTAAFIVAVGGSNQALFLWLNHAAAPLGSAFWSSVTVLGDGMVAFAVALLCARRRPDILWALMVAAFFSALWVHGLKDFFALPRPPALLAAGEYHAVGQQYHGNAFPSGHTATITVLLGVFAFHLRDMRWLLLLLPLLLLVAFSRIAVGVHWPLDVLFSLTAGWLTAAIAVHLASGWPRGREDDLHKLFVGLCLLAALLLPWHDTGYPQARLLQVLISVVVLVASWRELRRLFDPAAAASPRP